MTPEQAKDPAQTKKPAQANDPGPAERRATKARYGYTVDR